MTVAELRRCHRCGSTDEPQRHHIIPKGLRRQVEKEAPNYWNLYASVKFEGFEPPAEVLAEMKEAAGRWAALPHQRQLLCPNCHKEVHREIGVLSRRKREAEQSQCQCFDCEFFRQFDLGNLFAWFVPDSPLIALKIREAD